MPITEWYADRMVVINADFIMYDSFNESIEDHNKLLFYQRYAQLRGCTEYKAACRKVYECGYATDPAYPEKLIRIIEENKLYEFDVNKSIGEAAVNYEDNKIRKFQHPCNVLNIKDSEGKSLVEDNIFGWRTKSCIGRMPVLKVGSKGPAVEFVQQIVNAVPVDGDFGPVTKHRVIEYQKGKNIAANGIVGKQAWTDNNYITKISPVTNCYRRDFCYAALFPWLLS